MTKIMQFPQFPNYFTAVKISVGSQGNVIGIVTRLCAGQFRN